MGDALPRYTGWLDEFRWRRRSRYIRRHHICYRDNWIPTCLSFPSNKRWVRCLFAVGCTSKPSLTVELFHVLPQSSNNNLAQNGSKDNINLTWLISLAILERHAMAAASGSFSAGCSVLCSPCGFLDRHVEWFHRSTSSFILFNHLLFRLALLLFSCT